MRSEYLMIGVILKPQGLRGEVKIRSWAARTEMFTTWHTLYLKTEQGFQPLGIRVLRLQDEFVYAHPEGINTREEAEQLRGRELYVDRAHANPPEENATLIADLIGCEAEDENGVPVGILTDVLQNGPVDTWVFQTEQGVLMAPALLAVFPEVLPEEKKILVLREKLKEVAVES